jgi:alanyl-tRNA synthetase
VIQQEEKTFFDTIDDGLQRIERIFESMQRRDRVIIDGAEAADLYQTYGVPAELLESLAADRGFTFDWAGFRHAMEMHGEASGKLAHTVMGDHGPIDAIKKVVKETSFVGYETTDAEAEVKGIVGGSSLLEKIEDLPAEEQIWVILSQTPFYGESGGQVGDTGELVGANCRLKVFDTQRDGDLILHACRALEGTLTVGMSVRAVVDRVRRDAIRRAHSATHLLHYALQKNLGTHAQQQGSKVSDDWLRFDFTNLSAVSVTELDQITHDVREQVHAAQPIRWATVPLNEARAAGAMMLFGEKYPDPVRMVSMGQFSRELCGGTHLNNTRDVVAFEIISEEGVAAGTRRISALTGRKAQEYLTQSQSTLQQAAAQLKVAPQDVPAAAKALTLRVRELKKAVAGSGKISEPDPTPQAADPAELTPVEVKSLLRDAARVLNVPLFEISDRVAALQAECNHLSEQLDRRRNQGRASVDDLLADAVDCAGVRLVVAEVALANANLLRQLIDQVRKAAAPCVVVLATREDDAKVTIVAGVSRDVVGRVQAGQIVRDIAPIVGGGGGGKPDLAQAGGKEPSQLPAALERARVYVQEKLAG